MWDVNVSHSDQLFGECSCCIVVRYAHESLAEAFRTIHKVMQRSVCIADKGLRRLADVDHFIKLIA